MKHKNLMQLLSEGDYNAFVKFTHSSGIYAVSETDEADFYRDAPKDWAMTLINARMPSFEGEQSLVKFQDSEVVSLANSRWGLYPKTILWAFTDGINDDIEKIFPLLKDKPATEVEIAMLKRGDFDLFDKWLEKFGDLEEDSERELHESCELWAMKNHYIDIELSK